MVRAFVGDAIYLRNPDLRREVKAGSYAVLALHPEASAHHLDETP